MKPIILLSLLVNSVITFSQNRSDLNPALAPFYHGVASGDPTSNSVIIWTRVTTTNSNALVNWRVATDTAMRNIVKTGSVFTDASKDFTVKADVTGLLSDRFYYYEFDFNSKMSLRGRTKTAPSAATANVRFAVVSCSNYAHGYFNAYKAIKDRNDVDAVIHLGDYIYEYGNGEYGSLFNLQPATETLVLSDYRVRYNYYRLDSNLMRLHQQYPFFNVWDDHESADDSYTTGAGNHTEGVEGSWVNRKAASVKAYHEWLPTRVNGTAGDVIYRSVRYGNLGELFFLDTRLKERDKQYNVNLPSYLQNPQRKLIGAAQLSWFTSSVTNSPSQWKIIAQQVMMAPLRLLSVPANMDQWDGYAGERNRLYNVIRSKSNVVVLTGDIHSSWASELPDNQYVPRTLFTPCFNSAGVEFVVTSVTSRAQKWLNGVAQPVIYKTNSHIKYAELAGRGYGIIDLRADKAQHEWYFVSTIASPTFTTAFAKAYYVNSNSKCLNETTVATVAAPTKKGVQAPRLPRRSVALRETNIDITTSQDGNKTILEWTAATEENCEVFEVQRSINEKDFVTVSRVNCAGSAAANKYSFTDNNMAAVNYYRIAHRSSKGAVQYSPVALVKLRNDYTHYWYPNPTAGDAKLEINAQKNSSGTLRVYDASGRIALTQYLKIVAGSNIYTINTATLQKGLYVYGIFLQDEKTALHGAFIKL
ncbi:MAG: Alkaline phosphatase [Segetibacter sp.]|nr:Alkaline phosphatase [Segetibacter sp.]